ncbi:MAG: hypothetical protein JSW43_08205 [Gemmatimonadota bacterium]|nr:MAG: hypothetical protein JSW43_08205 [Gemmatimonadota bacterium]
MAAKDDPREKQKQKEAAIVDKLLRQLPHADPSLGAAQARSKRPPPPTSRPPLTPTGPKRRSSPLGVWVRVLIALVLGVAITQWPYRHDCGLASVPYLLIAAMIVVMSTWAAAGSWKHRLPVAHVLSFGLILWGLAVAAHDVLPRVGYAKAEGSWACATEPAAATPAVIPAVQDSAAQDSVEAP